MNKLTFSVVWHDAGCIVKCSDGTWLPFKGRRYSNDEVAKLGTKQAIAKLAGAMYRRFA